MNKEDIKSLGWNKENNDDYFYSIGGISSGVGDMYYTLHLNPDYPNKIEIRCSHPSWMFGSFLGICETKEELIDIMNKVGLERKYEYVRK